MSLPAAVIQVPVISGYVYRDADGSYPVGQIIFISRTTTVVVDGTTVTLPAQLEVTLDDVGEIPDGFTLQTVGDDGVYYTVVEDFEGGRAPFIILVLPTDPLVNLATIAPVAPAAPATPETVQAMAASAAGSAVAASASAAAAADSAVTAGGHAADAGTDAAAAAASAASAVSAANAAGISEANAAGSASDADTSAGQATASAAAAANSAVAASTSADTASGSAVAAAASASEADTSSIAAAASAVAAASSAVDAAGDADAAAASALAAGTSEDNALASANAAANSATAADGSADAAAQSATDAAALIAGTSLLRHGSGAPLDTLGNDGDYYIDDDLPKTLYGPKAAGAWPAGVSLKGEQGEQGETGATGPTGRLPAVQTVVSAATVTPTFADDFVKITAQAQALLLANPTGTPISGLGVVIRIKDNGTARAITYGSQYRRVGVALPTTTIAGKITYLSMIYNNDDTKWDVVAVGTEA